MIKKTKGQTGGYQLTLALDNLPKQYISLKPRKIHPANLPTPKKNRGAQARYIGEWS